MKKTSSMLYPVKRYLNKISRAIVQEIPKMLSATEILSASTVKRLVVEQGRFLRREYWVRSCKFQRNCNLKVFILKFRVANYELNLELQFNKTFAESDFGSASCYSFLWNEVLNWMLLKPLGVT